MFSRLFIAIIALFLSALTVRAADLEWIDLDLDHSDAVFFDGLIAGGDLQELTYLVERNHRKQYLLIIFNSNGGDIREAMKIGQYIRDNEFITGINDDNICYSVCFFSFIGGKTRTIKPTGKLGVHSFYTKNGVPETALSEYTQSMGVNPETIKIAARTLSKSLHVFNQAELERFSLISVENKQEANRIDEDSPLATAQPAENIFWQQDGWTVEQGTYGDEYCIMYKRSSSVTNGMLGFTANKGHHLTNMSYINEPEILAKIVKENKNMIKYGDENLVKIILPLNGKDSKYLLADYIEADETIEDAVSAFDMKLKKEDRTDISHQEILSIFTEETLIDMFTMKGAEAAFEVLDKCHAAVTTTTMSQH